MTDEKQQPEKKRPFDTYKVLLEASEDLAPRNKNLRFSIEEGKTMRFRAGQFVQMFIPYEGKIRRTSYSIASAPQRETGFDLCVTHVDGGVSSTFLHNLKEGDEVQAMGPLGKFTLPASLPRDVVFIATGSGIAPFRSMINDLIAQKTERKIQLLFGNRYIADVLYRKEWEALAAANPNFSHFFTLSRGEPEWRGARGYVQEKIAEFVPDPARKDFYICGLVKMIDGVTEKLKALGVPAEQIHFERYD